MPKMSLLSERRQRKSKKLESEKKKKKKKAAPFSLLLFPLFTILISCNINKFNAYLFPKGSVSFYFTKPSQFPKAKDLVQDPILPSATS